MRATTALFRIILFTAALVTWTAADGIVDSKPAEAQTTTVAGVMQGKLSVGATGQANYNIPIAVPLGIAGMAPNLSLSYSSGGGGGIAGVGWSVGGLSAIRRCPRTPAQDGQWGGIEYNGNGVVLANSFDLDGRLTAIAAGGVLDLAHTFDLSGNITAIADLGGGARGRNYVYDALYRLTRGQLLLPGGGAVGGQMDYAWDAVGNRTQFAVADPRLSGTETLTTDAFSNQLVSSAWDFGWTRALSHTDSGNRASDVSNLVGNLSMEYDSSDRLVEMRSGNKAVGEYLHNAQGQRVAKTAGKVTTHYLYDLGGNIVAEADVPRRGASPITAEYVWLGGAPLAYIVTANVYYVHADHLGTPQILTDGAAAVAWNADYAPFGYAEITGSITFNLRFPGQYYDSETQAHHNGFRTYDPSLGRYLESDPIGLAGGLNTYAYVGGNPVMWADPRGLYVAARWLIEPQLGTISSEYIGETGFGHHWTLIPPAIGIAGEIWMLQAHLDGVVECANKNDCGAWRFDTFFVKVNLGKQVEFGIGITTFPWIQYGRKGKEAITGISDAIDFYYDEWTQLAIETGKNPMRWCQLAGVLKLRDGSTVETSIISE